VTAPQVRERGILFSGPMVRAILAGRKTQTRRAMRTSHVGYHSFARWDGEPFRRAMMRCLNDPGIATGNPSLRSVFCENNRYGVPGDRLWVRETWAAGGLASPDDRTPAYAVDADPDVRRLIRWRPAILMPRWASRITLEITNVRVERAQAISAADVAAEGIDTAAVQTLYRDATPKQRRELGTTLATGAPSLNWRAAWTLINGRASWDANPWVWVVEFKVVTP